MSSGGLVHWDELAGVVEDGSHWRDLGRAAGCVGVRLYRVDTEPGRQPVAFHSHSAAEETFFILAGSGLLRHGERTYAVGKGDCIVERAGSEAAALLAGQECLELLTFITGGHAETTYLPRARAIGVGGRWVDEAADVWEREEAAGPVAFAAEEAQRPTNVVNVGDERFVDGAWQAGRRRPNLRRLGEAAGSRRAGLNHATIEPGKLSAPPHCHSAEEEIFVVLAGEGTLELTPSPVWRERGATDERHPIRAGSVVARPAGTRIAHALRAGDAGLTFLAYGTREPDDIAYYPRSKKVYLRSVGIIARLEHVDFWDGEREQ
jgi:uncharacterized cupin superfamily protein